MIKIFGQIIFFLFLVFTSTTLKYNEDDILNDLDNNGGMENPYKFFPTLEDGYTNISSNKIHLFADQDRWAIVFEKNGYNNRGYQILKSLTYFGNCLENLDRAGLDSQFICNTNFFNLCPEVEFDKIKSDFETVSEKAKFIRIRDKEFPIEHDLNVYKLNKIPWHNYDTLNKSIDFPSLTRMLNFKYPEIFNSTEAELRTCLPKDLTKLMTINEWYHTDCAKVMGFETESKSVRDNETFKLIAEVLVGKDITKYKPTKKPNSDWRNWNSGHL